MFLQFISKEAASIYIGMDMLLGFKMEENEWDIFLETCPNFNKIDIMLMKLISIHYLRWCSLLDARDNIALQFPDIYEPMIKLFERGGDGLIPITTNWLVDLELFHALFMQIEEI